MDNEQAFFVLKKVLEELKNQFDVKRVLREREFKSTNIEEFCDLARLHAIVLTWQEAIRQLDNVLAGIEYLQKEEDLNLQ